MDPDVVDITNIHRQLAYVESDSGKPKAERLAEICRTRNIDCNIEAVVGSLTPENAHSYIESHDVVFDCTDNVFTRVLISDTWVALGRSKLVISASCVGWCGQLVSLTPATRFCLRCIYGDPGERQGCDRLGQCAIQGVMGPVVSAIASLQLMALINRLRNPALASRLQIFEFNGEFSKRDLEVFPSCTRCSGSEGVKDEAPAFVETKPEGKEIAAQEFKFLLMNGRCKIIDVRERSHYCCSRLKNSVNIPASEYLHTGHNLKEDPCFMELFADFNDTDHVVVVCRRGIDSLKFVHRITRFWPEKRLVSLSGGLSGLGLAIV